MYFFTSQSHTTYGVLHKTALSNGATNFALPVPTLSIPCCSLLSLERQLSPLSPLWLTSNPSNRISNYTLGRPCSITTVSAYGGELRPFPQLRYALISPKFRYQKSHRDCNPRKAHDSKEIRHKSQKKSMQLSPRGDRVLILVISLATVTVVHGIGCKH